MIVIMQQGASEEQINHAVERIEQLGLTPHVSRGQFRSIIGAIGEKLPAHQQILEALDGVERVVPIMKPFKLASREFHAENSVVTVGAVAIGGPEVAVIAGPCAVENAQMLDRIGRAVARRGAVMLRGGAFKPRTSPYDFQGLGEEGLKMLRETGDRLGLPVVSEVLAASDVQLVGRYVDMFQIGTRNMQNFQLLKEVGEYGKPVLLKRGFAATVREYLMSAEYILSRGNRDVVLCERGIKTFENEVRFTLDVSAVPVIKEYSHLPIIVDPSHAAGRRQWVAALALSGIAAGADGIIVEVHDRPEEALCDGPQALTPEAFEELVEHVRKVAAALGRGLAARNPA
ncbi:MAG: 3-deoxy-7-phosphoheptulonate synthase [Phycisphaerae bacterium SM23_33]|jgi:3-deoxy-7-phosphoheptulonate synthase|nr:MAG: 3-deoxy-7-phosphoheptulonate synthase [Phycisphaerae bacterium SM23_33]